MDRRFLTVLGVSLVFALVVSSVFYQMTSRMPRAPNRTDPSSKDMVVATRPLGVGMLVKPADVKLVKIGTEAFPKGAFSKVEDVLDRPVVTNILLDEPILEGRLAAKGSGLGLAPDHSGGHARRFGARQRRRRRGGIRAARHARRRAGHRTSADRRRRR